MKSARILIPLVALVLAAGMAAPIGAQDDDPTDMKELLTRIKSSDCYDYAASAYRLIPTYYAQEKFDSIDAILQFVSDRCPQVEFTAYRLLRQLETGTLPGDWCDSTFVNGILRPVYLRYSYRLDLVLEEALAPTADYDALIVAMAMRLSHSTRPPSIRHAIAAYYAYGRDSVLTLLAQNAYAGTCLQADYDSTVTSVLAERRNWATYWGVTTGAWIPTGNLGLFGVKPEFGLMGGLRFRHFGGDLSCFFRILGSKDPYVVGYRDSLYTTDHFFDLYFGFDPVFRAYTGWDASLELFGGVGYEGVQSLLPDEIDADNVHYISSLNLNGGFTLRLFYGRKHTKYVGLQTRVSYLDFATDGGSDLSGAAVSISLAWGNMGHGWTDNRLEGLHYYR